MNATLNELDAPPAELSRPTPWPEIFESVDPENLALGRSWTGGAKTPQLQDQTLLRLLYELAEGLPPMLDVQPVRVWLCSADNRPAQLQLLTDGIAENLRPGMDFPLDGSIVRWVWEHQRPLLISAETETRFPDFARVLQEWEIKYFCAVPLMIANGRIGILGLASAKVGALQNFDQEFWRRGADKSASESETEEDQATEEYFEGIIGRSAAISALCKQIKVVAPTSSTALILGETGTGKELIARAIHNSSSRRNRPFIKVNCAAIPAGLIESELFGHERGAFTGALNRRMGRFEMADGGTLFLDEIGDIPLELQPKLLRVLQEQEFEPVGSTQTKRVNVRIVAATSRDLPQMVAARQFRPDLYYRLNVFPLRVPALRERLEDVPLLVRHFVDIYSRKTGARITEIPAEVLKLLLTHNWPGNVRELQNVIERAVILSAGKALRPCLDELQLSAQSEEAPSAANVCGSQTTLKDAEREHIIRALAVTNWVIGGPKGAAARLGLQRTTLIAKMQRLGITRAQA